MLLRLKYEELTSTAARGEVNGKNVNFIMRVQVDELTIVDAIAKFRGNKNIASLDYVGEPSFLKTIDLGGILIIITKELATLDANVDFIMSDIDSRIRVVVQLPMTYSDMKKVYEYSLKYTNLYFDGGNLIRLEGCNIGAVCASDIIKKVPESRIPLVIEGNGSVFQTVHIDDADSVEFYEAKLIVEKKTRVASDKARTKTAPKKQLSSLFALTASGGTDNF
jgi:hypothetical protein